MRFIELFIIVFLLGLEVYLILNMDGTLIWGILISLIGGLVFGLLVYFLNHKERKRENLWLF